MAIKIAGTTVIDDNEEATFTALTVDGTSLLDGPVVINGSGADADFRVEGNTDTSLLWVDAGSDKIYIGTTSTGTQKLNVGGSMEIDGNIISSTNFYAYSDAGGSGVRSGINLDGTNQTLYLVTGGLTRVTVDSNGDVGIGASPSANKLLVYDTPTASIAVKTFTASFQRGDGTYNPRLNIRHSITGTDINHTYSTIASNLTFSTGSTERMRISDLAGNVTINTTDTKGGHQFGVYAPGYTPMYVNRGTSTGNLVSFYYDSSFLGSISHNGSAISYNTGSDYRLKEDVQPMADSIARVMALKPVNFAWKSNGSRVDGFLAHEAQAVVPEAIVGEKDAIDEDGNPQYQGIDQSKFVPLLTAALQEALTEIEKLKAEVAALKGE